MLVEVDSDNMSQMLLDLIEAWRRPAATMLPCRRNSKLYTYIKENGAKMEGQPILITPNHLLEFKRSNPSYKLSPAAAIMVFIC